MMTWNRQPAMVAAIALLVTFLPVSGSASASIIDDKSDFVGDFTVIDFETWGDGTSIDLDEGEFIWLPETRYSDLGVAITARDPNEGPWVGNGQEASQFDAAHQAGGSPQNFLFGFPIGPDSPGRYLRFDFDIPVNAVALTMITRLDLGPIRMEIFDATGGLLDSVGFDEDVIDGTILGIDFGNPFDTSFGFVGLYSQQQDISYAIVTQDRAMFDDLHFGIIPEPTTLAFLALGGLAVARPRRRSRASC